MASRARRSTALRAPNCRWLLADIGGTYARLAAWQPDLGLVLARKLNNDQFPDLESVLRAFVQQLDKPCKRAAIAVALPIRGDRIEFTNRAWSSSASALRAEFGFTELRIVNDFAAAAAGLIGLAADQTLRIAGPSVPPRDDAAKLLLGPGTGLGVAAVIPHQPLPVIAPSEAGHVGCYAIDAASARVLEAARQRWGRVSWERLVSGPGLASIDHTLRGGDEALLPEQVAAKALRGEATAREAARVFSTLLGAFAGDMALAFTAEGGVYLGGGVLDGLGRAFDVAAFTAAYTNKGRFSEYVAGVPVLRLRAHDLAFRGLLGISSGLVTVPGLQVTKNAHPQEPRTDGRRVGRARGKRNEEERPQEERLRHA
jgi:glucokinase